MQRLVAPQLLGEILNDPAIAPLIGEFTPSRWMANGRNVALTDGESIGLFEHAHGDTYRVHWLFKCRGRQALDLGRAMFAEMFDHYGAKIMRGVIPDCRPASKWFSRQLGARSLGPVATVNGPGELFFVERSKWDS